MFSGGMKNEQSFYREERIRMGKIVDFLTEMRKIAKSLREVGEIANF